VPYFQVADPRYPDFPVRMAARGSIKFNITDYRAFIKLHRLISFDIKQFQTLVRDAVIKYVKGIINNVPIDHGIPVLQIERKLLEINDLIEPRIARAFKDDFGVNLVRFDLSTIEVDKESEEYLELRSISANLEVQMRQKQNEINMRNLDDTQAINAHNMEETLRIQREAAEKSVPADGNPASGRAPDQSADQSAASCCRKPGQHEQHAWRGSGQGL
jgi:membrane protease subunit (stomatin/prohibitin family)